MEKVYQVTIQVIKGGSKKEVFVRAANKTQAREVTLKTHYPWAIKGVMLYK